MIENGQAAGDHNGGPHALQGAKGHQGQRAPGHAAADGCHAEDEHAQLEKALGTQQVADATGREHEHRESDRISVDDPLESAHTGVQGLADPGQRDIYYGHVQLGDYEGETGGSYDKAELFTAVSHNTILRNLDTPERRMLTI